jgi:formylglycine-generating enzyme required for sulfatase activity
MMGASPEEIAAINREYSSGVVDGSDKPQHRVTIARPFAVGRFEVTFAEWAACIAGGGCQHRPGDKYLGLGRGQRPVIDVSWEDARHYLRWLNTSIGKTNAYRLLTEAEWEYAARSGTTTLFSFGDTITSSRAQYGAKGTTKVGSFAGNKFGLHDMHGNVLEWVEDCLSQNYNDTPTDGSAWTTGQCVYRVLRGGHWASNALGLRSSYRTGNAPVRRDDFIGFRVARTLDR